ncbi:YesK family protein [Halalkalibacterium halodurans]|jgi:hypothetical protein|uniref:YesK-like protein n=1 Tax=Halalkalibacterium halodurans TaxID=86665 RepID=A0A0M0KG18_ALKHA|nr:YesK family protein [Halalkalibacterium halodurans]MED3648051.1 YesK family protein [Halalkalibacterium halodurans]MED4164336.1 YesK family protein [Halalkalibacterium halodurans]TPE69196.1 hypothetical protein AMD02_009175 [Halalkalibacterium halodurans]
MFLLVPISVGIIVGLVVFFATKWLISVKKSKTVIYVPAILSIVISISLILYGFIFIRGFEGAAYLILSIIVLLFAIPSLFYARIKLN